MHRNHVNLLIINKKNQINILIQTNRKLFLLLPFQHHLPLAHSPPPYIYFFCLSFLQAYMVCLAVIFDVLSKTSFADVDSGRKLLSVHLFDKFICRHFLKICPKRWLNMNHKTIESESEREKNTFPAVLFHFFRNDFSFPMNGIAYMVGKKCLKIYVSFF